MCSQEEEKQWESIAHTSRENCYSDTTVNLIPWVNLRYDITQNTEDRTTRDDIAER